MKIKLPRPHGWDWVGVSVISLMVATLTTAGVVTTVASASNAEVFTFEATVVVPPVVAVVAGTPVRVADISDVIAGVVRCVPVVGMAGVPVGATGVILNVTTAGPAGGGNVVIYPDYAGNSASAPPPSSTVNFETGRDVANSAFVALPTDGKVCTYTQGASLSRLILDVTGYIVPGSGITLQSAQRLMDTRGGPFPVMEAGPVSLNEVRTIQVTGNAGVPAGATAVLVNVTVTGVAGPGHLRMWAAGTTLPNTSVVNYAQDQDKANGQIVALSSDGKLSFGSFSNGPVQVIIDVVGYVEPGAQFVGTAPTRVVETRYADRIGPIVGTLTPVTVYPVTISTTLVPASATAVVLNVTAVGPTGPGHLRVYPDTNGLGTTPPPDTSNINYIPGRDIPNMITVQLPADRTVDFYNVQGASSRTNLVVDVIGYIDATPGGGTTTPPPPAWEPWKTTVYYEADAGDFCAKLDAARQAVGAGPFASCTRSDFLVGHAEAMAEASWPYHSGQDSIVGGSVVGMQGLVNAFMASAGHYAAIVGSYMGDPVVAKAPVVNVGCFWEEVNGEALQGFPYSYKNVFCAGKFVYP